MPESEKPIENSNNSNNKKTFHKRRRFRKSRGEKTEQQAGQPAQPAQNAQAAQGSPREKPAASDRPRDQRDQRDRRGYRDQRDSRHGKFREKAPAWDSEDFLKAKPLPESKEELLEILAAVDPEELMMVPLVQKHKPFGEGSENEEYVEDEEGSENYEVPEAPMEFSLSGSPKVVVDMVKSCPICDKPIREIMYALHDYEHDRLAHFDCVFRKVSESLEDKLVDGRYLAYLGSGAFGIMESTPSKSNKPGKARLVEKIYPGAPVEELLHAEENQPDEEL